MEDALISTLKQCYDVKFLQFSGELDMYDKVTIHDELVPWERMIFGLLINNKKYEFNILGFADDGYLSIGISTNADFDMRLLYLIQQKTQCKCRITGDLGNLYYYAFLDGSDKSSDPVLNIKLYSNHDKTHDSIKKFWDNVVPNMVQLENIKYKPDFGESTKMINILTTKSRNEYEAYKRIRRHPVLYDYNNDSWNARKHCVMAQYL